MTPDPEDTGEKQANGRNMPPKEHRFKKGYDPKRNMRGVPKDTIAMRKHMREIAAELIGSGDSEMTRLSAMLRQLWTSRNPAHNKLALQVLDPKILTEHHEIESDNITKVIFEYSENPTPKATPSADADKSGAQEA